MTKWIPHVPKQTLLLIAGLVWLAAGANIMRLGVIDMVFYWVAPFFSLLCAAAVFLLFFRFIFYRMVLKHSKRILSYEEEKPSILKFFDIKSYCIMFFMITFGITLRMAHVVPPLYLGTFYTGLGASLVSAGVLFFLRYMTVKKKTKTAEQGE